MSIKLTVSPTVTVRVKGTVPASNGTAQPFDFTLICDRVDADELREINESDARLADVLLPRTKGWEHVLDEHDAPVPFSPEAFKQLFRIVGLAGVAWVAYLQACGAKGREKN
ncbi:hypothetical protein LNV23_18950 [Paucibacter sp. DJ1R-11]|uniref:hypothetical protein n=1 Tax=Paucibacter sp. DJ1R-11 TaxID=2893556 RepID=UPI0021E495D3|nr:hypothetical protein [Paucibacter sp. DJ1R-11]MCV2365532.1 hypothetical protein [Paucibacter sp. DJ1R-11]